MSKTLVLDGPAMPFFGPSQFISHVGELSATEILEFAVFEQISDALLWGEFRCLAWQAFQLQPFGSPSRAKTP